MRQDDAETQRQAQVRACLDRVVDPELDESVVSLRFITEIAIDDEGRVRVDFRLPTYWCAANFAFLMADDMRREVATLPWVTSVVPVLGEHMYADTVNRAMADGIGFREAFAEDAADDLEAVRATFQRKAFQRRQLALIDALLAGGMAAPAIVGLTLAALEALPINDKTVTLRSRYLERRPLAGLTEDAFVEVDGQKLAADGLAGYMASLRRVGINAEFNGALCRGLLAARFGEDMPEPDGEPTLADFARLKPGETLRLVGSAS